MPRSRSPWLLAALLVLLVAVSGCLATGEPVTASDRDQRSAKKHDRQDRHHQQRGNRPSDGPPLTPTPTPSPTPAVTPSTEPSAPAPAGSAQEYWDDLEDSRGETAREVQLALDRGALTYPVHRFVNPAGDVYCELDVPGDPPACETSVLTLPDDEWCGRGGESIGIRVEGVLPVPLCSTEAIRRPGALIVPVGGVADSGVLRCLVEAHGVTCVLRAHRSNGFRLGRDGSTMEIRDRA